MGEHPTGVAVVICTHTLERWNDIAGAVASVRAQTRPADEIVLVADHNDALLARMRAAFRDVVVVDNWGPRGESGARNAGVAATRSAVIAFLDDDAVADPHWLGRLARWYDDPGIVGVGGLARPRWDDARPSWFPDEFDWVVGCSYRGMPERAEPVRNLMGCNMSFRRSAIDAVGGFYTGLGRVGGTALGCSETEMCLRVAREVGGRFLFDPEARISHRVPAARGSVRYFLRRCRDEGRSKAHLAGRAGTDAALATERRYVRRVLPRGVARGVREAIGTDLAGLGRAAAIVAGAGVTSVTYARSLAGGGRATS